MGPQFSRISLRTRLLILVGIAIVPALCVILYTGLKHRQAEIADAKEVALSLARSVSAENEDLISQTRLLLGVFARLPEIQSEDWPGCSRLFADLIKQFPRYINFGVAGMDGTVRCSGLPAGRLVSIPDRTYFREALATGGFSAGGYQVGRITKKPSINFGHAVYGSSASLRGVVFAALDLAWLRGAVDRAILPAGSRFVMADRKGQVLVRVPESSGGAQLARLPLVQKLAAEGRATLEWRDAEGVEWLTGFVRVGLQPDGFYALVDIPRKEALGEANRVFVRGLLALGFMAVFAFAAAWIGGEWSIRKPIGHLLGSARLMAKGDLGVRTGLPHEGAELNRLARAFDEMAEALERGTKENHRNQELVFRSEKLATLGVLMAGAAHEVLNPANIIGLHAQRLINTHEEGTQEHRSGEVMWASVQRITDICSGLRRFSRDDAPKLEPLGPTQVADSCLQLLGHKLRLASVRVKREFGDGEAGVLGDRNRFMQVFLNLISNAADAMPGGGTLTLRTAAVEAEGRRWWEGRFEDTGTGILPEVMPHIFDPFFTTKPEDQGTGLGLSVSRQIAEAHGGRLWAESTPGEGAVFIVRFPVPEG